MAETIQASVIIQRWESVRPIFNGRTAAWVIMLRIIACGTDGIPACELYKGLTRQISLNTLKKWQSAGLVVLQKRINAWKHPVTYVTATPKAAQLLQVTPPANPSASAADPSR